MTTEAAKGDDVFIIREHLANGDKSSDAPLAALSRLEQRLIDAESDARRLHKEKIDLMEKYVWKYRGALA